jgi:hypothetical protein
MTAQDNGIQQTLLTLYGASRWLQILSSHRLLPTHWLVFPCNFIPGFALGFSAGKYQKKAEHYFDHGR